MPCPYFGETDQGVSAALNGGTDDAPDAEVAVSDVEDRFGGLQKQLHGQRLLADMNRGNQGSGRDAGGGTETDHDAGDAPIGLFAAGAVGREVLGDVAIGAEAFGRAIQQLDRQVLVAPVTQSEQNGSQFPKA